MRINEAEKRLRAIIDNATDGIATINDRGIIESVNSACLELFGYSSEELIGQNISILMPQEHAHRHDGYIQSYLTSGHAKVIGIGRELMGKRKDGSLLPIRLGVSEVKINDKSIFTGIIQDLTEIKEAQHKIEKLNQELENKVSQRTQELENVVNQLLSTNKTLNVKIEEEQKIKSLLQNRELELAQALNKEKVLNDMKSRFVSLASHEFRTPLTAIKSSASIIEKYIHEEDQEKRAKHLGKIKRSVVELTGILNDFLSLNKLDEGKVSINKDSINIDTILLTIQEDLSNILKKNQKFIYHKYGDIRNVYTDSKYLNIILKNLIGNAIKYSEKPIEIRVFYKTHSVTIEIEDRGIGISKADQQHLFQRFFRAQNAVNIQGTGIGLNIVKEYVDLLNFSIDYKSELNEGTTFSVTIPYE